MLNLIEHPIDDGRSSIIDSRRLSREDSLRLSIIGIFDGRRPSKEGEKGRKGGKGG